MAALRLWQRLQQTARLMVGLPDYEAYVAHMRTHHPDAPVLDRAAFVREMQQRRYCGRGTHRCC